MNELTESLEFLLEPAEIDRLMSLCGQFNQHLRQMERFLGVEINNRGNAFRVIGAPGRVRVAGQVIHALYAESAESAVTPERVHLLLQASGVEVLKEQDPGAQEMDEEEIAIRTRRGLVKGRSPNQRHYLHNIATHDLNFGVGPAGTGKTYLAVASAVHALEQDEVQRILLVRPAVEAGEKLGFLPGDMAQKIDPYLRPLYDALYEMLGVERVGKLIERNIIEVLPLAFMRGRTLNEAFIILDEAQNTTVEQMKMFLTRIGFGSTVVVTGDITQIDLPRGRLSGLRQIIDVLRGVEGISFTFFHSRDVVRHPLVQRIIEAYEAYEAESVE